MSPFVLARYPKGLAVPAHLELSGEIPRRIDALSATPYWAQIPFAVDWRDSRANVLLHFNPRPEEGAVVLNSCLGGEWGEEVRASAPFSNRDPGDVFRIRFDVLADRFRISLDGAFLCEFAHRAPPSTAAEVTSSAVLSVVEKATEHALREARSLVDRGETLRAIELVGSSLERDSDRAELQELLATLLGVRIPLRIRAWRTSWPLLSSLVALIGMPAAEVVRCLYPEGGVIDVHLKEIDHSIRIRSGSSDLFVLVETYAAGHRIAPAQVEELRTIVDLGANIGATLMQFATVYPSARIFGVELDAENVELARSNTKPWADRVVVIHGAVAAERGRVAYRKIEGEGWACALATDGAAEGEAITIDDVIATWLDDDEIDFLKIDIEGAEEAILKAGGDWSRRTACLQVELHGDYTKPQAREDLARLGFLVADDEGHWNTLVAWRPARRRSHALRGLRRRYSRGR